MAVIQCAACGNRLNVTGTAATCPKCGATLLNVKPGLRKVGAVEAIVALLSIAALIWLYADMKRQRDASPFNTSSFGASGASTAGPTQLSAKCEAQADYAKGVVQDRDRGVTRQAATDKIDKVSDPEEKKIALSVIDTVYTDPKTTADSAYETFGDMCQMIQSFDK